MAGARLGEKVASQIFPAHVAGRVLAPDAIGSLFEADQRPMDILPDPGFDE